VSGRIGPWLSGLVELLPLAIKDAEGVGSCLQHFHVMECQPKALEFALADPEDDDGKFQNENAQRFLLSKGDAFYVPPGNVYRLENHSESERCLLGYTIIRPYPEAELEKKEKR
jgi:centromere protein C